MSAVGSLPARGRSYGIRFESLGGLGADAASQALAATAVAGMGLDCSHIASGRLERKGSRVRSHVKLAPAERPIREGADVDAPDAIVVFHAALLRQPETFAGLRKDGVLIYNAPARAVPDELAALPSTACAVRVDAAGIAAKEKSGLEAAMLGALCAALPFLDAGKVLETYRGRLAASHPDAVEPGTAAFHRGTQEIETLAGVGEAEGDLPTLSPAPSQGTGSAILGALASQPGSTIGNDLAAARSGFLPAFNRERCIHCALCDIVCPDFCLVWEKGEEGGRFERELTGVDYRYCKGCMRCVESCPASAMLRKAETPAFASQRSVPLFPDLVE